MGVPHNSESDVVVYFDGIKLYETAVLCSSHPYMIDLSLIPWTQRCNTKRSDTYMVCWSEEVVASRLGYGESMLYKPCVGYPGSLMLDQDRKKAEFSLRVINFGCKLPFQSSIKTYLLSFFIVANWQYCPGNKMTKSGDLNDKNCEYIYILMNAGRACHVFLELLIWNKGLSEEWLLCK